MIGVWFAAAYTWAKGFLNRAGNNIINRAGDTIVRR